MYGDPKVAAILRRAAKPVHVNAAEWIARGAPLWPNVVIKSRRFALRVREKEFDGFDGILLRSKTAQKGIIGVNAGIREPSRKRFTVALEIGHFVIPHHRAIPACVSGSIETLSRRLSVPELDAMAQFTQLHFTGAPRLHLV